MVSARNPYTTCACAFFFSSDTSRGFVGASGRVRGGSATGSGARPVGQVRGDRVDDAIGVDVAHHAEHAVRRLRVAREVACERVAVELLGRLRGADRREPVRVVRVDRLLEQLERLGREVVLAAAQRGEALDLELRDLLRVERRAAAARR